MIRDASTHTRSILGTKGKGRHRRRKVGEDPREKAMERDPLPPLSLFLMTSLINLKNKKKRRETRKTANQPTKDLTLSFPLTDCLMMKAEMGNNCPAVVP